MTTHRTRRWFLKTSAAAGASAGLGTSALTGMLSPTSASAAEAPDLVAAVGSDPFKTAVAAMEKIGGMLEMFIEDKTVNAGPRNTAHTQDL